MGSKIYTKAEREKMERESKPIAPTTTEPLQRIGDFDIHPAASAFPLIEGPEYAALVDDIKRNGLHEPIWAVAIDEADEDGDLLDWTDHPCFEHDRAGCDTCRSVLDVQEVALVLDGRNRLRACLHAGVEPRFRRYEDADPVGFVVSMNIHRRHLDESQRGMIAARLATLPKGRPSNNNDSIESLTRSKAAELLNVGRETVTRGRAVLDRGVPELAAAVDRGELAISRAAEISRLEPDEQRRAIDPAYGNGKIVGTISGGDDYNSDEWYTPTKYIDAAREVLGEIDLDPATCEHAQSRIKAARFFTKSDDGLSKEWRGRVWLNPPYSQPAATNFAEKLIAEYQAGRVTAGIVIQNASTDTGWFHALAREGAICLTRGRINFDREDGKGSQNRYGQAFFYLGDQPEKFESVFAKFGLVGRLRDVA